MDENTPFYVKNRAKRTIDEVPLYLDNFDTLQNVFDYYKQVMVS